MAKLTDCMKSSLLIAALGTAVLAAPASAQVGISGYSLPLELAIDAAKAAVKSCEAKGWPVTATVVDTSGLVKVTLKADHAVVHTADTAFRKAYTIASLGPVFGLGQTSEFVALVGKIPGPSGASLTTIPNVIALAGGVAIKHGSETVAGIGVGGAPGGDKDEACARDGIAAIEKRLGAH